MTTISRPWTASLPVPSAAMCSRTSTSSQTQYTAFLTVSTRKIASSLGYMSLRVVMSSASSTLRAAAASTYELSWFGCELTTVDIGPAFHQAGRQPEAPCPVCAKEKGDNAPKQLFSLRGFNDDQHDPAIPPFWFKAPPMKLEGKDKEMEALRVRRILYSIDDWLLTYPVPIHCPYAVQQKCCCFK